MIFQKTSHIFRQVIRRCRELPASKEHAAMLLQWTIDDLHDSVNEALQVLSQVN